jgi:cell wall-associated NlpC family hydrolase
MRISATLILIIFLSGCVANTDQLSLNSDLDSICVRWVPDDREGICNIEVVKATSRMFILRGETNIPEAKAEIVEFMQSSGVTFLDSISLLPDTVTIPEKWGLVTVSVSNHKKEPSYASEQVSQAVMGTPVKLLKRRGGWLLVQTPDFYLGWVNSSSIVRLNDKEFGEWKQAERLIYTAKAGDILSTIDRKEVISDIVNGAILIIKDKRKEFFTVTLPDGREGIIPSTEAAYFSKWSAETKPAAKNLINFAKSMKGSPYMWGGTSSKAVDCSGFTKSIFFTGGVILARDASQQFRYGDSVDVSASVDSLVAGDLLFFGYFNDNGEKRITHTGMYIGDNEVIHSSGMVRINSLDPTRTNYSSYLKEGLMGARRIIGKGDERGFRRVESHTWYIN